jgi:hypothetical protein
MRAAQCLRHHLRRTSRLQWGLHEITFQNVTDLGPRSGVRCMPLLGGRSRMRALLRYINCHICVRSHSHYHCSKYESEIELRGHGLKRT